MIGIHYFIYFSDNIFEPQVPKPRSPEQWKGRPEPKVFTRRLSCLCVQW